MYERRTNTMLKGSLSWNISDEWTINLSGVLINSWGFTRDKNGMQKERFWYITRSGLVGISYTPRHKPGNDRTGDWSFSVSPVFSSVSFHSNYNAHSTGVDFSLSRSITNYFGLTLGHTNNGRSRAHAYRKDGTELCSIPFYFTSNQGELLIDSYTNYALVDGYVRLSDRFKLKIGAGAAHIYINQLNGGPVAFSGRTRFSTITNRCAFLSQISLNYRLSKYWEAGLGVRYTNAHGVQISNTTYDPDESRTTLQMWSIAPKIALRF